MMTPCYRDQDSAVSPVVGVMLMLVVTIIIAAVVSAFAGGLSGSQTKTPQATIVADEFHVGGTYDLTNQPNGGFDKYMNGANQSAGLPVPLEPASGANDVYIIFEHKGGDPINLANIEMKLSSLQNAAAEGSTVSNANVPLSVTRAESITSYDSLTPGLGNKSSIAGFSKDWSKYLERYPDHGTIIQPGNKFVLHADYVAKYAGTVSVSWLKDDGVYPFTVNAGDVLTYQIIDKASGRQITSGQIAVPEITG